MEYFTSYARNFLLNIIPYNQDKILRTDAITFKVKITQYGRIVFSTNESPSPSPNPVKPHNTFHPSFEFLYLESGDGGEKKVWNERGHRMIYLECKSFLLEARGSPRFRANFEETIRISFVPLSSLDIEYLPPPRTNFSLPFSSPRPRDSSLFPRGGIHLGGELSVLFFSLPPSDCSSAGRREEGNRFRRKTLNIYR